MVDTSVTLLVTDFLVSLLLFTNGWSPWANTPIDDS